MSQSLNNQGRAGDARLARSLIVFLSGLLVLLLGAGAYVWSLRGLNDVETAGADSGPRLGGPFDLMDQTGQRRTEADFAGRHMLTYFGYTYCPDVCPTSVALLSQALDLLEEQDAALAEQVVPVFFTVDPARDDVAALAAYAEHFHPRLVALTGTEENVSAAAKAYRVFYRKVEDESAAEYLMDHSSFIYLIGPDGYYSHHFAHNASPREIAGQLREILDR